MRLPLQEMMAVDNRYLGMGKKFTMIHIFGTLAFMGTIVIVLFYFFLRPFDKKTNNPDVLQLSSIEIESAKKNEAFIRQGAILFKVQCASCHGFRAEGIGLAPSLIEANARYGHDINKMIAIISNGSELRGMPAWKKMMQPKDILCVATYLTTLKP